MGQYTEVTLALTRCLGPAPQRRAQEPLVPREGALRLPALPVDPAITALPWPAAETLFHLPAVARLGPLPPLVAAVERDYGRADAQLFAAEAVVLLAVEGGVAQYPVPGHPQGRLLQGGAELRRVITGTEADGGRGEEVTLGVADGGEFGPDGGALLAAGTLEEVTRGVVALQAGGIDGGLRLVADQAALPCARGGLEEEQDELPFFNSRPAA